MQLSRSRAYRLAEAGKPGGEEDADDGDDGDDVMEKALRRMAVGGGWRERGVENAPRAP